MKLQDVIKILLELSIYIHLQIDLLEKTDSNEDSFSQIILENEKLNFKQVLEIQIREYCIINICSYVDEYQEYLIPNKVEKNLKDRVVEIRKVLKPFFKEINHDYNLKDYRNQALAHNLRLKNENEKSLISGEINKEYSFPKSTSEFKAIFEIIKLINAILLVEFMDILPNGFLNDKAISNQKVKISRNIKQFNLEDLQRDFEKFNNTKNSNFC